MKRNEMTTFVLCIDFVLCLFKIHRMGNAYVGAKKRIISLAALSIFLQCFNLIWSGKWLWMMMVMRVSVKVNVKEYIRRCACECECGACMQASFVRTLSVSQSFVLAVAMRDGFFLCSSFSSSQQPFAIYNA